MKLKIKPANDRGFLRADFKDYNGVECSIQESSLATEDCLWLGCNEGTHHHVTGDCLSRMHLTKHMAAALLPLLLRFVRRGTLEELPPDEQLENLKQGINDFDNEQEGEVMAQYQGEAITLSRTEYDELKAKLAAAERDLAEANEQWQLHERAAENNAALLAAAESRAEKAEVALETERRTAKQIVKQSHQIAEHATERAEKAEAERARLRLVLGEEIGPEAAFHVDTAEEVITRLERELAEARTLMGEAAKALTPFRASVYFPGNKGYELITRLEAASKGEGK